MSDAIFAQGLTKAYDGKTVVDHLDLTVKSGTVFGPVSYTHLDVYKRQGLNIDYFPTNFVPWGGTLYYIDYECNAYMEQWDFEHWGAQYWTTAPS